MRLALLLSFALILASTALIAMPSASGEQDKRQVAKGVKHASLVASKDAVISLEARDLGLRIFVESNGRRVVAFKNDGKFAWCSDLEEIGLFQRVIKDSVILVIRYSEKGHHLWASMGNGEGFKIDPFTGETQYVGHD